MNAGAIADRLARFPDALDAALGLFAPADVAWKPSPGEWSALEVAAHLADEEEFDFRVRLRSTLESPDKPWPPIDPEGWVLSQRYAEMDVADVLARFRREREKSVAWLRSLAKTDWETGREHPKAGLLRAGDLATAWAAHDALHLRQLARLAWKLAARDGAGYSPRYAGEW